MTRPNLRRYPGWALDLRHWLGNCGSGAVLDVALRCRSTAPQALLLPTSLWKGSISPSRASRCNSDRTSAPRLHDKIDGANLRRGAVSRFRNSLMAIQNGRCFYNESHDMASPEVDHVLPWSFVLEDRVWNLACSLVADATIKSGTD